MKRRTRVDAAQSKSKAAPVTETVITTTTTGRSVPLAHTAAERLAPVYQGVAAKAAPLATGAAAAAGAALPLAHQVYGKAVPLAAGVAAAAVPLAQQAYEKAAPLATNAAAAAGPLAHQAYERTAPLAHQAYEKTAPLAGQAVHAIADYAHAVADRAAPLTEAASHNIAPVLAGGAAAAHQAVDRVAPALENVRERVSDQLLPSVGTALTTAATSPLAVEAVRRGRATVAAARGELTLPEEKEGGSWVKRVAVVAALAGVAVVVVRKLLASGQDSGWQAARPSAPSPAPTTTTPAPVTTPEPSASVDDAAGTGVLDDVVEAQDGGQDPTPEAVSPETVSAEPTASSYGEGSYTGSEPPEGFVIKGNENSKKYHLPGGGGYDQTVAEVWFDSEEAAERAGFVRAQG